ncbi:MAG: VWA domain-containing protein [Pyrinomonadaceae bacterium]|nr:VWA domain-containing protein [Pyrinomonadaceae bacterium]
MMKRMTSRSYLSGAPRSVMFGLLLLGLATVASGQDEKISIESQFVRVPVLVTDRDGRSIVRLKRDDLVLFENGVRQEISSFESVDSPITILLLVDRSRSMYPYFPKLDSSISAFIQKLRPDDGLIILTFADSVEEMLPLTQVRNLPEVIQLRKRNDETTRLYRAIDTAITMLDNIHGRTAIVLFSNGLSGEGDRLKSKTLERLKEARSVVYPVFFPTQLCDLRNAGPYYPKSPNAKSAADIVDYNDLVRLGPSPATKTLENARKFMLDVAASSGGRFIEMDGKISLVDAFLQIVEELSRQYQIGYEPKIPGKQGESRKISVKVNIPGSTVRARNTVVFSQTRPSMKGPDVAKKPQ